MGGDRVGPSRQEMKGFKAPLIRFQNIGTKMIKSNKFEHAGQELVEFAIILPLLLVIAFGVLDLGRALHAVITITNVARVGARYGVDFNWEDSGLPDPLATGYSEIINVAFLEADDSNLDVDNLNVSVVCSNVVSGKCQEDSRLTVTAIYDFELLLNFFPSFSMTRYTTMMIP